MRIHPDVIAMMLGLPEGTEITPALDNDENALCVIVTDDCIPDEALEVTGRMGRIDGVVQFLGYELVESMPPAFA